MKKLVEPEVEGGPPVYVEVDNTKVNAFVFSSDGEATVKLALKWKNDPGGGAARGASGGGGAGGGT